MAIPPNCFVHYADRSTLPDRSAPCETVLEEFVQKKECKNIWGYMLAGDNRYQALGGKDCQELIQRIRQFIASTQQ